MKTELPASENTIAALRLPRDLRERAKKIERDEDVTFSQIMRRALRRELEQKEIEAAAP